MLNKLFTKIKRILSSPFSEGLCLNLKQRKCRHRFDMDDLEQTGIPELGKPATRGYEEWAKYFQDLDSHESITKRVKWPCAKCGKIFYAHCGLDIAHDGNIIRRKKA